MANNNISSNTTAWTSSTDPQYNPGFGSNIISAQPGFIGGGIQSSTITASSTVDTGYVGGGFGGGMISSSSTGYEGGFGGGIASNTTVQDTGYVGGGGFGGGMISTSSTGYDGGMGGGFSSSQVTSDSSNNLGFQ